MYVIARHQHNICLNNYEYVLDDSGNVMDFKSVKLAMRFLTDKTGVAYRNEREWEENEGIIFLKGWNKLFTLNPKQNENTNCRQSTKVSE